MTLQYTRKNLQHFQRKYLMKYRSPYVPDRRYQGAPEVPGGTLCTPIKKKKGAKLTEEQKEYNKIHSKIRVYVEHAIRRVKTWRIMGNVYRNPLIKYDRINDIVCGLVNRSILWRLDQMA